MSKKVLSVVMHSVEAVVVVGLAILIAFLFPEHKTEALVIGIGSLSALAKGLRVSSAPIPDYVNDGEQK